MVARAWGEEEEGICLKGSEFQFYKMKSSAYLLHNNGNMLNTTELYT